MNMETVKSLLDIFEVNSVKYLIQKLSEGAYSFQIGRHETLADDTNWNEFWSNAEALDQIKCECKHDFNPNCQYNRFEELNVQDEFIQSDLHGQVELVNKFFKDENINLKCHLFEIDDYYTLMVKSPKEIDQLIAIWG